MRLSSILAILSATGGFLSSGLIGIFVGSVLSSVLYRLLLEWVYDGQAEYDRGST